MKPNEMKNMKNRKENWEKQTLLKSILLLNLHQKGEQELNILKLQMKLEAKLFVLFVYLFIFKKIDSRENKHTNIF